MKRVLVSALFATAIASSGVAHADPVKECIKTADDAQLARASHHLVTARDGFARCAADVCPSVVKKACAEWLDEIEPRIPSVVVTATSADADLSDATITIDDHAVIGGHATLVDPGSHVVKVTSPGFVAHESTVVASEGARRTVRVRLERALAKPKIVVESEPLPVAAQNGIRPTTLTWITGGLALAATASFVIFGAQGRSGAADLRERCAPNCTTTERDDVKAQYLIADVSLVAALVLGGVSVGSLFFPGQDAQAQKSARRTR